MATLFPSLLHTITFIRFTINIQDIPSYWSKNTHIYNHHHPQMGEGSQTIRKLDFSLSQLSIREYLFRVLQLF